MNTKEQWGFSIDENSTVSKWTKLELMPQPAAKELEVFSKLLEGLSQLKQFQRSDGAEGDIPKYLIKTSSEIIEDFLKRVAKHWRTFMRGQARVVFQNVPVDIAITHPAVKSLLSVRARSVVFMFTNKFSSGPTMP
jgi:hypothetical protein